MKEIKKLIKGWNEYTPINDIITIEIINEIVEKINEIIEIINKDKK